MKIGIDASRYGGDEATGVEWYSKHIIDQLVKLSGSDEMTLYCREGQNLEPCKYLGGFKDFDEGKPLNGGKPLDGCKPLNERKPLDEVKVLPGKRLWTLRSLSREMRAAPPDVLFVPSHVLPLSLPGRSVITIHDTAFRHLRKVYSFKQYHYLNWSTKYAVKHADTIIVPSKATRDDLVKLFGCPEEKIRVIPHGFSAPCVSDDAVEKVFSGVSAGSSAGGSVGSSVSGSVSGSEGGSVSGSVSGSEGGSVSGSEVFEYFEITRDSEFLFFVGRLESKKNLVRLIEAFDEFLKGADGDYRLVLAGKRGVGFEEILKTVNKLGLAGKVIMPGYITEVEKAALYKYCKAFVFPSLYEGFGLPILEAFHYGKPVLSANTSSLPEVCGDAAVLVDPYDIGAIAAGLAKVVADDGSLVKKGRERLREFSWEKCGKETLEVLKGVD